MAANAAIMTHSRQVDTLLLEWRSAEASCQVVIKTRNGVAEVVRLQKCQNSHEFGYPSFKP